MMDINEIREYLPHRYPFLLVDRVVELDVEGKRIRAYKNVSINEPFFNGCLLYTSPSPRDRQKSRMPSSA